MEKNLFKQVVLAYDADGRPMISEWETTSFPRLPSAEPEGGWPVGFTHTEQAETAPHLQILFSPLNLPTYLQRSVQLGLGYLNPCMAIEIR